MPINTTTTCKNMCGPLNRCAITGENCKSDVDCFGCKPLISGQTTYKGKIGFASYGEIIKMMKTINE